MRESVFALFVLILSGEAYGQVYPWVWVGKNDIQVTDRPKVELETRLELVRKATQTLDIVTYDQRIDARVGLPLLQELEEAAKRGVRVRLATAWVTPLLNDPYRLAEKYIREIAERHPHFKFISVGGQPMWSRGWGFFDGIHQKLFLADRKIALITGRGHADQYLSWLDTAFFIKGELVAQAVDGFERMWNTISRENGIPSAQSASQALVDSTPAIGNLSVVDHQTQLQVTQYQPFEFNESENQTYEALMQWILQPPSQDHDYQARGLYYDFLEQMRTHADAANRAPRSFSYEERAQFLHDPILNEVMLRLPETQTFQLSILAVILDSRFRDAILTEMSRGMQCEVTTNGWLAHSVFPTAPGWYAGVCNLDELMQVGTIANEIYKKDENSFEYIHRKMAILDDQVFFGSHNLTRASTLTIDEFSIQVRGVEFANQMRELSRQSVLSNSRPFVREAIHDESLSTPFRQWFGSFFETLYFE